MKTILTYPIPFNVWEQFDHYVFRFIKTFKQFPPEADYELLVTCHWGEPTDQIRRLFYGTKTKFLPYYGNGCQIGAQLSVAESIEDAFIIGFTSHAHFHRSGWLNRLMEVRRAGGPGLYGVCSSRESCVHLRTNCYGMDAELWHAYPYSVSDRQECTLFECGEKSVSAWYKKETGKLGVVVYWDSSLSVAHDQIENGYRDGNQEQLLVWDRHTDMYAEADEDEKKKLSALARGISLASSEPKE